MASASAAAIDPHSALQQSFEALEKQKELITSCTQLWKELSDHFSSIDRGLILKSHTLSSRRESLRLSSLRSLESLRRRELSIDSAVDLTISKIPNRLRCPSDAPDLAARLRSLCAGMDGEGFFDLVVSSRKEMETLRSELPSALLDCIDPPKLAMDAISKVFPLPVGIKSKDDFGWACVLVLESLVPALADPELGESRPLVTGVIKERARGMADAWKDGLVRRGGVKGVRASDVHAFLQMIVTFGIVDKGDRGFYRELVMSFAWRKQMPKLALSLGLEDRMTEMIEELINKGQQIDAINFAYEAGLPDKFPPVPMLNSYLKDLKKDTPSNSEDSNSSQTMFNTSRKEQSALRAVMKCIEERKLEAEFPLESLQKRLEYLEKAKVEKKKPSSIGSPANKRTRANNGAPMPPAKAGRLANNAFVSSFLPAPTFVRSPSSHITYSPGHGVYGSQSPPVIRDPCAYPRQEVSPTAFGAPYISSPMNYPSYGGYSNGLGIYSNGIAPGYQQAYYR